MPEANANETKSAPDRVKQAVRNRTQKHIFWGRRVWQALQPAVANPAIAKRVWPVVSWLQPKVFGPAGLAVLVVGAIVLLQFSLRRPLTDCAFKIPAPVKNTIPGRPVDCVRLEVAQTSSAQTRGLSGRKDLARDAGMLFIFEEPGQHCMWMKDMHFPLDILWLDEERKIVDIKKEISPDTYPRPFCGPLHAKYVVEVNAGIAGIAGLQVGQHLNL